MGIQTTGEGLVIKKEINVGHIMTALAFLVSATLAYGAVKMDIKDARYESQIMGKDLQGQIEKNTYILNSMMKKVDKMEEEK